MFTPPLKVSSPNKFNAIYPSSGLSGCGRWMASEGTLNSSDGFMLVRVDGWGQGAGW